MTVGGRTEITALTGLRGIGAFWVVTHHLLLSGQAPTSAPFAAFFFAGDLGVDLFFFLSGFVIALTYLRTLVPWSAGQHLHFLGLRLARIYPLYLLAIPLGGLSIVIGGEILRSGSNSHLASLTPESLLANVLMVQAWIPGMPSWDYVSWSLSAEWLAYLAFPALAIAIARIRSRTSAVVLLALGMAAAAGALGVVGVSSDSGAPAVVRVAFEFTAGVLMFRLVDVAALRPSSRWDVLGAGCALGILAVVVGAGAFEAGTRVAIVELLGILVLSAALSSTFLQRFLGSRLLVFLGTISYSVYLLHPFVISVLATVWGRLLGSAAWSESGRVVFLAITFVAVAVAATIAYRVIELPARQRIRTALDRRSPRVAAT